MVLGEKVEALSVPQAEVVVGWSSMVYDANDLESAALCAWKEARGDGQDGMRAVLHVIVNRVGAEGFGKTLHDVVYGKNQFSSMSIPSDPEFHLDPTKATGEDASVWDRCHALAEQVLDGTDEDLTNGARYYADLREATSGWFFRNIVQQPAAHPFTVKIGSQSFYQ